MRAFWIIAACTVVAYILIAIPAVRYVATHGSGHDGGAAMGLVTYLVFIDPPIAVSVGVLVGLAIEIWISKRRGPPRRQ
jgi:hypothetical protein